MANGNFWKYGLTLGLGVAVGAVGAAVLSRGSIDLKKTCATLLSHGMDLKDKVSDMAETAKENIDDITAEAKHERNLRKGGEQKS